MNNFSEIFFKLLYVTMGLMFLRGIQKTLFMKLNTPMDYVQKANYLTAFYKMRGQAIKTLQSALDNFDELTDEENSFIHFQIGVNYFYKKKYTEAVKYFDIAWPFLKKAKIPFNKIYASIVVANFDIGNKEKAREIYHFLLNKQKYDPRFASLSYLENSIFK